MMGCFSIQMSAYKNAEWNLVVFFSVCVHQCIYHGHIPGWPESVSTMPPNAVFFGFRLFFFVFLSPCPSWTFCVGENADKFVHKVGIVQKENPLLCLFAIKSFVICYYIMGSRLYIGCWGDIRGRKMMCSWRHTVHCFVGESSNKNSMSFKPIERFSSCFPANSEKYQEWLVAGWHLLQPLDLQWYTSKHATSVTLGFWPKCQCQCLEEDSSYSPSLR